MDREEILERSRRENRERDEMEREVIRMETLAPLATENGCHYVIFRPGQKVRGKPEDYGWERFGEAQGYVIYRNTAVELTAPDAG